jgi:hypothetical protein
MADRRERLSDRGSRRAGDFKTEKGETLTGWSEVQMLELDSKGGAEAEPIFSEFRWVQAE